MNLAPTDNLQPGTVGRERTKGAQRMPLPLLAPLDGAQKFLQPDAIVEDEFILLRLCRAVFICG
jgi:hypothetical protein